MEWDGNETVAPAHEETGAGMGNQVELGKDQDQNRCCRNKHWKEQVEKSVPSQVRALPQSELEQQVPQSHCYFLASVHIRQRVTRLPVLLREAQWDYLSGKPTSRTMFLQYLGEAHLGGALLRRD